MKRFVSILSILWACLWVGPYGYAQTMTDKIDTIDRNAEDFIQASLLIADPGDVLYSTLGHLCLRLQCPTFGLDYCFSYESESVRNRVLAFLAGNLQMGMFAISIDEYLAPYRKEGRGVREYMLNLTPVQEQQLWRLADEALMQGINLPYDFVERGCGIATFRLLRDVIGKENIQYDYFPPNVVGKTWKDICYEHMPIGADWTWFMISILVGTEVDRVLPPAENMIIPADVIPTLQHATVGGNPVLSLQCEQLVETSFQPQRIWYTPLFFAMLLLMMECVTLLLSIWYRERPLGCYCSSVVDWLVLSVQAIFGTLMTYIVLVSDLPCTQWNWLLIPFNILPIICWHWRKWWALPYAVLLMLWVMAMVICNISWHILVDWSQIVLAIAFIIVLCKQVDWKFIVRKI